MPHEALGGTAGTRKPSHFHCMCALAKSSPQPCAGSVGAAHKAQKNRAEVSLWQEEKEEAEFRGPQGMAGGI